MAKPRVSILDPKFKYSDSASTDVGRHLREHKRKQRDAARQAEAKRQWEAQHPVVQIKKRSASC